MFINCPRCDRPKAHGHNAIFAPLAIEHSRKILTVCTTVARSVPNKYAKCCKHAVKAVSRINISNLDLV